MHIERMLLLNQTSCEIPLEVSYNNSLRQGSYCTTNHRVILGNVCDPFFETGWKEDQPRHLAMHCCGNLGARVSVDSSEFCCRYTSAFRSVTSPKIFIIYSHQSCGSEMESFFTSYSLSLSLVQWFLLYIL